MAALIHEFGYEGYGRFWRIVEIIAERMDKTDRCHAELPAADWCEKLKIKRKKLDTFLVGLALVLNRNTEQNQNQMSFNAEQTGNKIKIEWRNLLKKKDEYTEKSRHMSGHSPKNVSPRSRSKSIEVEEEGESNNTVATQEPIEPTPPPPQPKEQGVSLQQLNLAARMRDDMLKIHPGLDNVIKADDWASTVRDIMQVKKRTDIQILDVWEFARGHSRYWAKRIRGPADLLAGNVLEMLELDMIQEAKTPQPETKEQRARKSTENWHERFERGELNGKTQFSRIGQTGAAAAGEIIRTSQRHGTDA